MKSSSSGTTHLLRAVAFVAGAFFLSSADATTVISPDGNLSGTVVITSGRLTFSVAYKGQAVVKPSALGVTVAAQDLGLASALGTATTQTISETYPLKGGHATATNNCNVASIPVTPTGDVRPGVDAGGARVQRRHRLSLQCAGQRQPDGHRRVHAMDSALRWHDLLPERLERGLRKHLRFEHRERAGDQHPGADDGGWCS